ncbi:hypothetical protein RN001_014464 [Aquatica leii]|uniref:Centriolar coiled-coil protein of 110 kDa n=1 Tax=Aquatica leii TaxID=1421715 RepID=A0AAN7PYJ4_9COLE|nr:hypothetical protein RN001_014464 [Aquatica leii]
MTDNIDKKRKTYISCIKIGGVPILPPLITPSKRLQMQLYRKQAVAVEKRIKTRIEQEKLTLALNKTLESSLAFDSLALEICDEKNLEQNLVPFKTKSSQLSCNIFDVTEYNDNGIILFNEFDNCESQVDTTYIKNNGASRGNRKPSTKVTQPRLIRSNSYTLDAPSPILMEHFKKHIRESPSKIKVKEIVQKIDILPSTLPYTSSDVSVTSSLLANTVQKNLQLTSHSVNEIIKDLANVHFGDGNNSKTNKAMSDNNYTPEFISFINTPNLNVSNNSQRVMNSKCCGDSIDTTDQLDSSSILLIDFESDTGENLTFCCDDSLSKISAIDTDVCCSPYQIENGKNSCSRVLFTDTSIPQRFQEERAATILTAAVRGYLVRRLKRTERVKNLVQTIRDALLCAMSLHSEKNDSIQPPDVELHRRLIQQISAACYEFYDIFFNLTIKEKMELIAVDRLRIKEKLKRPSISLNTDSEKSESSLRSSPALKQKKTLLSSLVA